MQAVCAAIMFLLAWQVWLKANRIWAYRDSTDVLRIVYGPFVYFMAVSIGLAGLIHLYSARAMVAAPVIEGLVGLTAMMALAFLRIPIAFCMGIVGIIGYAYMRDWNWMVASAMVQTKIYETGRNYTLSVVPLFILMGNFVTRAGMSQELFRAAYTFIGHLRGGLAMATVWASAGFGGICGSSIATAATFAKVAYPSMKQFGYSDRLAAGVVAGGGTLGIMIPPSTIMVIYGVFTETNIGKLFAAGILPGILGAFLLCGAVQYMTWRDPALGPAGRALDLARAPARAQGRVGGGGAVHLRDGRHLRRLLHRHRGRGHGRLRGHGLRPVAARAHLADALRVAPRERPHHVHAVRDPDRRADLRGVRQHHDDAGGPQGLGDALQPEPDHGGGGDLPDLRGAGHGDGGAVDDPAHDSRCSSR